jgi:putative transposase
MARPLRIEYAGALYHITSRGNAREDIFITDEDRKRFLEVLALVVKRYRWKCFAYCLMNNHYHLLIETITPNLSLGMRQLNGVYTQLFNRLHKKTGHVFQGRFKAFVVEKDNYLLALSAYITLNPMRAKMVKHPKEWRWSSYRATIGQEPSPEWLYDGYIREQFGSSSKEAIRKYQEFVFEQLKRSSPWDDVSGQVLLGGQSFIEEMAERIEEKCSNMEIPRVQRHAGRPPLNELFTRTNPVADRDAAIMEAYVKHGYKQNEIARHLNVHYGTISKIIKRNEARSKT